MTEFSSPWNLLPTIGDAQTYSATEFATYFNQTAIGEGANLANRGVVRGFDNELRVVATSPTSTSVNVSTGAAYVQGFGYVNSAVVAVPIAANGSGLTRIDVIVLRTNFNNNKQVRVARVQGTPGGGVPGLSQVAGSIWEIPLAYVTLANGFSTITDAEITNLREYVNIPSTLGFRAANGSGGTLETGAVVVWSGAGFTTTTTEGLVPAGVLESRTLNAGTGRLITEGLFYVLCDESVVAGDFLTTSTTAGQAQKVVGNSGIPFARVLVANTGAGTRALCYVRVPIVTFSGTPATKAIKGSTQAINATTDTQITFSGTDYDDLVWFNNGADSIVVTQTGRYQITLYATLTTTVLLTTAIKVNGAVRAATPYFQANAGTYIAQSAPITWEGLLTAADIVTAYAYVGSNATLATTCYLSVRRIG